MTAIEPATDTPATSPIGRQFLLAGKAIFTVSNPSGTRYTYRVTHKPGNATFAPVWFVSLLTGSDNESDYTYLGILDAETGAVRVTKKGTYTDDTLPVKVVRWAVGLIYGNKPVPDGYKINHAGRCGKCGRLLTTPESCAAGIGPECRKKMFG